MESKKRKGVHGDHRSEQEKVHVQGLEVPEDPSASAKRLKNMETDTITEADSASKASVTTEMENPSESIEIVSTKESGEVIGVGSTTSPSNEVVENRSESEIIEIESPKKNDENAIEADSTSPKGTTDSQNESMDTTQSDVSVIETENEPWLQCARTFANFIENSHQEGISILSKTKQTDTANPKVFLPEMINFLTTVRDTTKTLQRLAQTEINNLFSESLVHYPEAASIDLLIERDPAKREIRSSNDREFLIKLGPYQPILRPFPKDKKGSRFNPKWYEEYNFLEYSVHKDAAFCFVCSLFPEGFGRSHSETHWSKEGVRGWKSMNRNSKHRKGKLLQHFNSKVHKAALQDYLHFIKEAGRIDVLFSKEMQILNKITEEHEKLL